MRAIDADALTKDLERLKGQSQEIDEILEMFIKLLAVQPAIVLEEGGGKHDERTVATIPKHEKGAKAD